MSHNPRGVQKEMQQAFEKHSLKRVIKECMYSYFPRAKYLLAEFLFGGTAVKNAFEEAEQKQNVPRRTILSVLGDPLGFIRGNGTLFESLKGGVAWNEGEKPPEFFNLWGINDEDYYLLPYNVPISKLPSEVFLVACDTIFQSKEHMLNDGKMCGNNLFSSLEALRDDREVVLVAVTNNGMELMFASNALRADRDVVLAAVQNNGSALMFASEKFKNDPNVVLAAVAECGVALKYASKELQADSDFVLRAVTCNPIALKYASKEHQNDPNVVLAAVKQNGMAPAHMYASELLAIRFASNELQADSNFVRRVVTCNPMGLMYAAGPLREDYGVVLAAVTQDGDALKFASDALKKDRDLVRVAVKKRGHALVFASDELRSDPELAKIALENSDEKIDAEYARQYCRDILAAAGLS